MFLPSNVSDFVSDNNELNQIDHECIDRLPFSGF